MRIALALLLVLIVAAPAQGAVRTQSAQAFADAALRAHVAMRAESETIDRRMRALRPRLCISVLRDVVRRGRLVERRSERVFGQMMVGFMRPLVDVIVPVGRHLVADLDAVPTRDPALIAGRDAWRELIALFEAYPVVTRPCHALDAWRDSGFAPALAPPDQTSALARLDALDETETFSRRVGRAQRRLRMLGVTRGAAARFSEDLIDVYDYGPHLWDDRR